MNVSLTKSPIKSFIIYEIVLNVIGAVVLYVFALSFDYSFKLLYGGLLIGSVSITVGFILIVKSADIIIEKSLNEKQARTYSLLFFTMRYAIYLVVCGLAIKFLNINILTTFLGLFTIRIIIVLDHYRDKK